MAGSGWTGPRLFALLVSSPRGGPRQAGLRGRSRVPRTNRWKNIEVEGRILTVLAGTMFRVELDNKHQVLATISGKMRKRFVRLIVGDRVKMEMSPYDLNKARIVWRLG